MSMMAVFSCSHHRTIPSNSTHFFSRAYSGVVPPLNICRSIISSGLALCSIVQASTIVAQSTHLHIVDVLGFMICVIIQALTTVAQLMTLHIVHVLEFLSIGSRPTP